MMKSKKEKIKIHKTLRSSEQPESGFLQKAAFFVFILNIIHSCENKCIYLFGFM